MSFILIAIFAYLLGAAPTGLLIGRAVTGKDVRQHGSGNIGASNVARVIGKKWGVVTFLADFLKGFVPVLIARYTLDLPGVFVCATGLAAIIGHVFPVYLKFKGGKGVATSAGVLFVLSVPATLVALIIYAIVAGFTRISSIGSLTAGAALTILMLLFNEPFDEFLFSLIIMVLLVFTHRENIKRLIYGDENRL